MAKVYKVKNLQHNEIEEWTIEDVLREINFHLTEESLPYSEDDWEDGWKAFVENNGNYKMEVN